MTRTRQPDPLFQIPVPITAHRGFAVTRHEEIDTRDGVAFRTEISYQGQVAVTGENTGTGGADRIEYRDETVKAAFLALADGTLLDADGQYPAASAEDILEVLISAYESELFSVSDTLMRTDVPPADPDRIVMRETFRFKGRFPLDRARLLAGSNKPPCTQWYVPGTGWIDLEGP